MKTTTRQYTIKAEDGLDAVVWTSEIANNRFDIYRNGAPYAEDVKKEDVYYVVSQIGPACRRSYKRRAWIAKALTK